MISNEETQKSSEEVKSGEGQMQEANMRKRRSGSNLNNIVVLAAISCLSCVRHSLIGQSSNSSSFQIGMLIMIDILHFICQLLFYFLSKRHLHKFTFFIFIQSLFFIFYLIITSQYEKHLNYSICSSSSSNSISTSSSSSQSSSSSSSYSQKTNQNMSLTFFSFCEGSMDWYRIQGQFLFIYLQQQENLGYFLFIIACQFIVRVVCFQDYIIAHLFYFVISLYYIIQKRMMLAYFRFNEDIFSQTFSKLEFWLQYINRYIQTDVVIVQLSDQTPNLISAQSNHDIFALKNLETNSGGAAISNKLQDNKKTSIQYNFSAFKQNNSPLLFPFFNLSLQSQSPSQEDLSKPLTSFLNSYIFPKFQKRRASPILSHPHKSLQESRVHYSRNVRNGLNYDTNNTNNNNNINNNNNNNNNNLVQTSRQITNQNIQNNNHHHIFTTNQYEDTMQFDNQAIQFSSFNQFTAQNKNNSNNCIYLLQNSSMQHIPNDPNKRNNFSKNNYNTNYNNYYNNQNNIINTNRGSIYNPILKRNTIQTHFNLLNGNQSERKNSLVISNSPQIANLNQLENNANKQNTSNKAKDKTLQVNSKQNKSEVNQFNEKRDNNNFEYGLKEMEGETLLQIARRLLSEQRPIEQNEIIDQLTQGSLNKQTKKNLNKGNEQSQIKGSKLGKRSVYILEKQQTNNNQDGVDQVWNGQLYKANCIECVYSGKHSLLISIEEINHSVDIIKQINSSPESNKNDNLKVKTFKQKIISSLAHELKTPLNSIISQVSQMLSNRIEGQHNIIVKTIDFQTLKSNASLLNYKIEDLLNYSMHLQGENKMNIEKFSIQDIMNEMIEIFKPQAKLKQLYFHSKISLLQTSNKKSLELKNEINIPQINEDIDEIQVDTFYKNMDNPIHKKDHQFCPVAEFKKKFVSLKFMSEKIIKTPISDIYSNGSIPSQQQADNNRLKTDQDGYLNQQQQQQTLQYQTIDIPIKQPDIFVRTDKKKLICILINLLTNALKFTFKGGISFVVNQIDKYTFEFIVTDTGIGIADKLVKKMNNTSIEDYDTIFLNDEDNDEGYFNDQEVSEELEDSVKNQKQGKDKESITAQLQTIKGIEMEKQSEGEVAGIIMNSNENREIETPKQINTIKRILDIKDICRLSHNNLSDEEIKHIGVSQMQENNNKNNNMNKKSEVMNQNQYIDAIINDDQFESQIMNEIQENKKNNTYDNQLTNKNRINENEQGKQDDTSSDDKHACSISLMAAQEMLRKNNLSIFSNNNNNNNNNNYNSNNNNNNQTKQVNQQYKSQPSLYNFQRNCGIGIKLVKILSSQLSQNQSNLKIKSKENQGSTFTFVLQDQQQQKTSLSQYIIGDRFSSQKKQKINQTNPQIDYYIQNHAKDEVILSDDSIHTFNNEIKSQSMNHQTNLSQGSIAEFHESNSNNNNNNNNNNNDNNNNIIYQSAKYKNENMRHSVNMKFKTDLDYLADQNRLNSNSLKLQVLLAHKKILIVDDMPFNIEILKNYLKGVEDLEIKEAFNGMDAVEMVQSEQFDLIFMDINMPVMDGIEATLKITDFIKLNQISPVPIIIVSAYTATQDIQNSLQSGATVHVSKPITINNLINAISQAIYAN